MSFPRDSGHLGPYQDSQEYTRSHGYDRQAVHQDNPWRGEQNHYRHTQEAAQEPAHQEAYPWQHHQGYESPNPDYAQRHSQQRQALQHDYPVPGTSSSVSTRQGSFEQDVGDVAQAGPDPRPMFESMLVQNTNPRQWTDQFVRRQQSDYAARGHFPPYVDIEERRMRGLGRFLGRIDHTLSRSDQDNTNGLQAPRPGEGFEEYGQAATSRHRHGRHGRRSRRGCRSRRAQG